MRGSTFNFWEASSAQAEGRDCRNCAEPFAFLLGRYAGRGSKLGSDILGCHSWAACKVTNGS